MGDFVERNSEIGAGDAAFIRNVNVDRYNSGRLDSRGERLGID